MRVTLQLVISHGDGHEETVTDVITLKKNNLRIPRQSCRLFHTNIATDSIAKLPPIPGEGCH
jgi:hypothetical protein